MPAFLWKRWPGFGNILLALNEKFQGFQAYLSRPDLGDEVVQGTITVDRLGLHFRWDASSEYIRADDVVIEKEGKHGPICFYDSNRADIRIYTWDNSIVKSWSSAPANNIRLQMRAIVNRADFTRALRVTLYVVAGCVLLAWLGSWAMGAMVRVLVARVPPEWEQKFGDEQIKELKTEGRLVNDTNSLAELATLAEPLLRVVSDGKTTFKFHIADTSLPNAFAMPGGHIVVNTGLLELTDDPDELLGVLAHELAHVKKHHIARQLISAAGPLVIFGTLLHSQSGVGNVLSGASGLVAFQSFSKEYESEADSVGWDYLVKANIDPRGMIEVFRKFKKFDLMGKVGGSVVEAFSSHPALDKRIARLERKWKKMSEHTNFVKLDMADWAKLKADPNLESAPNPGKPIRAR